MKLKHIILFALAVISTEVTASAIRPHSSKHCSGRGRKAEKNLVILYENDVHCAIDGYAKMAGLRDAIQDTAYCLMVGCGDYLQGGTPGAISSGKYVVDIMKTMRYDALALGNHEFDYGTPRMKELLSYMQAPVTCVNLRTTDTKQLLFAPYIINKVGKHKVAFIGALTPTTLQTEAIGFYDKDGRQTLELAPTELYQLVENAAIEARKKGADIVIVLSHLSEDNNQYGITSHGLISKTTAIDAVFDGHSHSVVPQLMLNNREGKPVVISQTGTQFAHVGKCVIPLAGYSAKKHGKKVNDFKGLISTELIPTKSIVTENAVVKHATDSITALFQETINRVICHSDVPVTIDGDDGKRAVRFSETNAGDLVCDAFRHATGAQISMNNSGGIRTSLPVGEITYGDIISLLPFQNMVSVVEVSGQKIIDLLNACTQYLPNEHGDFPQVAGIRFTVDMSTEPTIDANGKKTLKRVSSVEVWDDASGTYSPINPTATYTLATTDYCIGGGGLQAVLQDVTPTRANVIHYAQSLIKYVTEILHGHIDAEYAQPKGRIIIK